MTKKQMGYTPGAEEQSIIDAIALKMMSATDGMPKALVLAAAGDVFLNTMLFVKRESRLAAFDEYTKHARTALLADLEGAGRVDH